METVIGWPGRYLMARPQLLRCVTRVTFMRSRGKSIDRAARRLRWPGYFVRRCYGDGLDTIANGLRRDEVPIF
jgi:hypothetical protein